jgi:DNA-binding response OmpR family regulator
MSEATILIADDNVGILKALKVRLAAEGFTVISAQDAYQALELARKHRPDLFLLDVNMPAGNGFSVQERVSKCEELRGVPVIYITGDKGPEIDRVARQVGAYCVIRKPFTFSDLLVTIHAALQHDDHESDDCRTSDRAAPGRTPGHGGAARQRSSS